MDNRKRLIERLAKGQLSRRELLKLWGMALAAAAGLQRTLRASNQSGMYDVIIVGGGLSGLTAAYAGKDANILVLEKEHEPGGRICTGKWEEFYYGKAAAYLGKPDEDMTEFFNELSIKPIPVPPPADAIAYKGKLYQDASAPDFMGSKKVYEDYIRFSKKLYELAEGGIEEAVYTIPDGLESLAEYEELDQYSVKTFMDREGIHELVQLLVDVENRGLFGASNDDFSFLFNIPEMAYNLYDSDDDLSDWERLVEAAVEELVSDEAEGDAEVYTFPKGMIELVWALEKRLKGKIESGAEVTDVVVNSDESVTVAYRQGGKEKEARAHAAILATPAPVTASIVRSGFSPTVMEALRAVQYTTYVTMALFLSERVLKSAWNVSSLDTVFTTMNDAIRTQAPLDYTRKGILGLAMPPKAASDRTLIEMSDDALLKLALADVERYFPGISKKVVGKDIHRIKYAFPVFRPKYGEILWALYNDESIRGPLLLAGDYMVYPTLGGAAVSGFNAAEVVEEYLSD